MRMPAGARRIAIAATFTSEPVQDSLLFWMRQLGLPFEVEFAPYSQVFQELLDPRSLLSSNERGVNVVAVRLEDLGSLPGTDEQVEDLARALETNKARSASPLIVCLCPESTGARREDSSAIARQEGRLASAVRRVEGVHFVGAAELRAASPPEGDGPSSLPGHGHVVYGPSVYTALGTSIARTVHALECPPFKVLVLDCDQTLWGGVCGEDGPLGVTVDAPRRRLQEFALAQRAAGVSLCLSSKNSEN